jgi:endonuclease-3
MAEKRAEKILKVLRTIFTMSEWTASSSDPFETLIMTVISQNTADRNTERAFENLSKCFKITPEVLANAKPNQIEECLRNAGLYRNKARAIKQISKTILEKFHGDLEAIMSMPFENARAALLQFPGVGPKTADVVLLFAANRPTLPVDTHVGRVSKRLGLAPAEGNYEIVRESLQSLYESKDYLAIHVLLISHGRKYCKARNPICTQCPLSTLCPSKQLLIKNA